MRPTDENQGASMRPNLMSPKRGNSGTSGEDSILAMLERDPARKRVGAKGVSGARLAWYGCSAVLAVALTGTLVWLAAGNDGRQPDIGQEVLAEAAQPAQRPAPVATAPAPATPAPAVVQVALAADAPQPARPPSAAVIVDQQPAEAAPPPLRLLKQAPAAPVPKPQAATPARPAARPATPAAPAASPAQAAAAKPATPASRPPATATAPARPRPTAVARNTARPPAAKGQRGAQPARKADAPVDPDVALISAVIVHANGHAPEGSQMTELLCPKESCQPKARPAQH